MAHYNFVKNKKSGFFYKTRFLANIRAFYDVFFWKKKILIIFSINGRFFRALLYFFAFPYGGRRT